MRYWTGTDWRVTVIDAGFQDTGDAIVEHVLSVYGTAGVEHLVSTHPDNDHISSVRTLKHVGPPNSCFGFDGKYAR